MRAALSTMWAQQERFRGHMDDFARIAAAAGYDAIEPSHSTDREGLETLVRSGILPLASLHAPTPRERNTRGHWNGDLNLAALEDEERRAAVRATARTIDYAVAAGAQAIVVHLGACGDRLLPSEAQLRNLHRAGVTAGPECDRLRAEAVARREELATLHLPQARRSLEELTEYGTQKGVAIGLENRLHYHEIPRFDEVTELLAPYPASAAGYWHDVGHAEVLHRLGLVDKRAWLQTNGPRAIGSHLHDVRGIIDHRAPGAGDVVWDYILAGLPETALRTFEIDQHEPEELLNPALRYLIDRGVMPA